MKTRLLASLLALLLAVAPALADQSTLSSPTTGTVSGLQLTNNYNAALNALNTCNSGGSAPTNQLSGVPSKGNCWLDTGTNTVKLYDGTNWLPIGQMDTGNHIWQPFVGGGVPTIASAATTDLCTNSGTIQNITGVTTITSFGGTGGIGCVAGQMKVVNFTGSLTLTHNGVSLVLPNNGGNIQTTANDTLVAFYLGSSNWRVVSYIKTNGQALQTPHATVTGVGDTNYVILTTDQNVFTNASFTLARTWTLPSATAYGAGNELKICDENAINGANTLSVTRAGADAILMQGTLVNTFVMATTGQCLSLISDGGTHWAVYAQNQAAPQYSTFTSGSGLTYTTPVGATYLKVRMIGGGGGGSNNGADGGTGGTTSFGSWTAIGGAGSRSCSNGGSGGANGAGVQVVRMQGAGGNQINISLASAPGTLTGPRAPGASSPFGGGGGVNVAGVVAYGSGGASNVPTNGQTFCSGSAGEYVEFMVPAPAATYTYTVGGGGTGQTGSFAGAPGVIIVEAIFQ